MPKQAFEQILDDHGGLIWRIATLYEADPDLRRDLHQDMLVAVWRSLKSFRGDASVKTYIARVAHNRGVSHVSKEAKRPRKAVLEESMESTAPTPEESASEKTTRERLERAVRSLPLDQQQPVALTLEGFQPKEIADVLGVTANTVSIRLTRAKAALRDIMGGH